MKDINDILPNDFEKPKIDEFLGQHKSREAILVGVSLDESHFGEYVVLKLKTTEKAHVEEYRTGGELVIRQAKALLEANQDPKAPIFPLKVYVSRNSTPSGNQYFSLK